MANDKLLPQDVVTMYCEDDTIQRTLLYCESVKSFYLYQEEEGYFKLLDDAKFEPIIFRYMLAKYRKAISSSLVKDVIKMMRYFVYNRCDNNINDYIALSDKKVLNTSNFEIIDANPTIHAFSKVNCSSEDIKNYTGELPRNFKEYLDYVLVDKEDKPDTELMTIVQEMFGYYLLNTIEAHASFFLVGSGGNGKSVMLGLLREMVGKEFSSSSTIEYLTTTKHATVDLIGKKMNICDEDESKFVNSAKFKTLVSGDPITVEPKFQASFTWKPTLKFAFSTNEMPTFTGFNKGLTRRMFILPFNKEIPDSKKDTRLPNKLAAEMKGIIPWAIEGAKRLIANKFKFSESKQLAEQLSEFIKNISSAALFISEMYEPADYDFMSSEMLYDGYKLWCEHKGKKASNYYNFIKETGRALNLKEVDGNSGDGTIVKGFTVKIIDNNIQTKIAY